MQGKMRRNRNGENEVLDSEITEKEEEQKERKGDGYKGRRDKRRRMMLEKKRGEKGIKRIEIRIWMRKKKIGKGKRER